MVMVYVPGGTLTMGSTEQEIDAAFTLCEEISSPCNLSIFEREVLQEVTLAGFWIDKYEVSTVQYQLCVDAGVCEPSSYAGLINFEYPITNVSWFDAETYSIWVEGTLPTEAEWEYAARGIDRLVYPWGDEFDGTRLNYCDFHCGESQRDPTSSDRYPFTSPVGSFPTGESWVGAQDMAGNVWEWTDSWFDGEQTRRIVRGGSWKDDASFARTAFRGSGTPDSRNDDLGFRVIVRLSPPS
jgi:formylglycine-generating enzyme required for sulfatase activity